MIACIDVYETSLADLLRKLVLPAIPDDAKKLQIFDTLENVLVTSKTNAT